MGMAENCLRCQQGLSPDDTIQLHGDRLAHLDCRRPRDLSHEQRAILFRYCFGHAVATCPTCAEGFRQHQLGADLLGHRERLCPRCRADLTESVRGHVFSCAMLPAEVRQRAREARDAGRRLVESRDHADVLMREAEAAVVALRATLQRTAWRD
jgi:hypothetical protein